MTSCSEGTIVPSPFFPQDVNSNTMIGAHGYCTQELVNLALTGGLFSSSSLVNPERTVVRRSILAFPTDPTSTKKHATHPAHEKGRACSNVFDGQKDLGEGMLLKGLTKRSDQPKWIRLLSPPLICSLSSSQLLVRRWVSFHSSSITSMCIIIPFHPILSIPFHPACTHLDVCCLSVCLFVMFSVFCVCHSFRRT